LQQIRDSQAQKLDALSSSLTTEPPQSEPSSDTSSSPSGLLAHLSSPFYHDWSKADAKPATSPQESNRSHDSVSEEIMDLRQKLEQRKQVQKAPVEVEKAKEGLVQCLRHNDRRPLDCWQEVEAFKREVGKLEQAFIQKAGR
jgi:altered-inheritance-of-mitochondria protein 13